MCSNWSCVCMCTRGREGGREGGRLENAIIYGDRY